MGDCPYCWIYGEDGVGEGFLSKSQPELTFVEWVNFLNLSFDDGSVIDFCGGEPTIFPNFSTIVNKLVPGKLWAMTTNLHYSDNHFINVFQSITKEAWRKCISMNCSYHPGADMKDFCKKILMLRQFAGGKIAINFVMSPFFDHTKNVEEIKKNLPGVRVNLNDYQNPQDSNLPCEETAICSAGMTHCVINSNGDVYRCLNSFRSNRRGEFKIGKHKDNCTIHALNQEAFVCNLNCDPIERKCWNIVRHPLVDVEVMSVLLETDEEGKEGWG